MVFIHSDATIPCASTSASRIVQFGSAAASALASVRLCMDYSVLGPTLISVLQAGHSSKQEYIQCWRLLPLCNHFRNAAWPTSDCHSFPLCLIAAVILHADRLQSQLSCCTAASMAVDKHLWGHLMWSIWKSDDARHLISIHGRFCMDQPLHVPRSAAP